MLLTPGAVGFRCVGAQYRLVRFTSTAFSHTFFQPRKKAAAHLLHCSPSIKKNDLTKSGHQKKMSLSLRLGLEFQKCKLID